MMEMGVGRATCSRCGEVVGDYLSESEGGATVARVRLDPHVCDRFAAWTSGTCTSCGERVEVVDWPEHRERVHGYRPGIHDVPPGTNEDESVIHEERDGVCVGCEQFGEPVEWLLAEARGHSDERTAGPKWVDLFGMDPDYTGGMDVNQWLDEQRGEA